MATEWQIGDRIENRWEIRKILRGGMGIVYVVYDHEWHEAFAAKTFQDQWFARCPESSERFAQEASAWINLDLHENVTQAHFVVGVHGKPFLFLEYVSGGDLSAWVGTRRLIKDSPQVLRFAIQFCDGMIHALSKGIKAHRDIKPQNCLITEDGTLKVTDFGLAKVFAEANPSVRVDDGVRDGSQRPERLGAIATRTMIGSGTPPYMAPEQFHEHVDIRADVYSLGIMLFQMLTGRLPFLARSKGPIQEMIQEFERLHKTAPVPKLEGQLSMMNALVQTCLAKRPENRFADFRGVRECLAEIYEKQTGEGAPQPKTGMQIPPGHAMVRKAMSLSILGRDQEALVFYDRALAMTSHEKLWAVLPWTWLGWCGKGVILDKLDRWKEALACFDRALAMNPRYGRAWHAKGNLLGRLGRADEALTCFDRALAIDPGDHKALLDKGVVLAALRRLQDSLTRFDKALTLSPHYDRAWFTKGSTFGQLGRWHEALACFNRALDINSRYEEAWCNKGAALGQLGGWREALACYDRALELNLRLAQAWIGKGNSLSGLGRHEEALACFERVLELNSNDETAWYNKGNELARLGRWREAVAAYDQTLAVDPHKEQAWLSRGATLDQLGQSQEAVACYDRTLALNPLNVAAWCNRAVALSTLGHHEEAIACYDRALALNPQSAVTWFNKGAVLLRDSRRVREAVACFDQAKRLGHPKAAKAIAACRKSLGG